MATSGRTLCLVLIVILFECSGTVSDPATEQPGVTASPTDTASTLTTTIEHNGTLIVHFINVGQSVSTLVMIMEYGESFVDSIADMKSSITLLS